MHTTEQLNTALGGRYAIERRIGEGGMAVVYLARDLKHNRQVALKVLNPELGAVLGSERFMAEIEVTANLHHPNLLPLFDSGEAGGLLFYAMPYIEGETLRTRLARERQLSVDDAVRIGAAIASALDYAHRHHVIHRDLKPENILMHEGQPLVMDFGIALAVSKAGGARITQTGLSLGTPQYMSPEQATGDHALDARTDIYSLGAVVYEMLVGDPPHTGSTVQAVIAKVITEHPSSIRATRPNVPEHVEAAVMMALAKIPADRFNAAADFAAALTGMRTVPLPGGATRQLPAAARTTTRRRAVVREAAAWIVAAAAVLTTAWTLTRPAEIAPMSRLSIDLPDSLAVNGAAQAQLYSVGISRDGKAVVVLVTSRGRRSLYVRQIGDAAVRELAGTRDASSPKFSPDGNSITFVNRNNELIRIPSAGGTPHKLADSVASNSWGDDGNIYFQRSSQLWVVNEERGDAHLVASPDTAAGFNRLSNLDVLPGAKYALVRMARGDGTGTIALVDLSNGRTSDLHIAGSTPKYVNPGFMLYESDAGVLSAVTLKVGRRPETGEPIRIADGIERLQNGGLDYSVSADQGTLVFRYQGDSRAAATRLSHLDARGVLVRLLKNDGQRYDQPRVSPDGRYVAVRLGSNAFNTGDIWVLELASGALTRLTTGGSSYRPSWSRDGKRIIYLTGTPTTSKVISKPWDGSGSESVLLDRAGVAEFAEGPRGAWSALRTYGSRDIMLVPADSIGAQPTPFVTTPDNETDMSLSPSGHLLAYTSDETGRREVYVRPVPGPGPRVPVSVNGGRYAMWSADGRILYFLSEQTMMAAAISEQPAVLVTKRDSVFQSTIGDDANALNYAPMPDGRGFIISDGGPTLRSPYRLVVISNWQSLFARAASTDR